MIYCFVQTILDASCFRENVNLELEANIFDCRCETVKQCLLYCAASGNLIAV